MLKIIIEGARGLQRQVLQDRNTRKVGGGRRMSEFRGTIRQVRGEGVEKSESGCICALRVVHYTESPKKRGGTLE